MKTDWLKISLIFLLLFTACRKSENSSSPSGGLDVFGLSDQTQEAIDKIDEANKELKRIKDIYRESETQRKELKEAMDDGKDIEKVKKLANELKDQINEGLNLGRNVISKIEEAEEMQINDTYKEYLDLKQLALKKQLEAFEIRFDQVRFLRDEFQITNKEEIEKAKARLKEMDEEYDKKMEAARDLSRDANRLYKESLRKTS